MQIKQKEAQILPLATSGAEQEAKQKKTGSFSSAEIRAVESENQHFQSASSALLKGKAKDGEDGPDIECVKSLNEAIDAIYEEIEEKFGNYEGATDGAAVFKAVNEELKLQLNGKLFSDGCTCCGDIIGVRVKEGQEFEDNFVPPARSGGFEDDGNFANYIIARGPHSITIAGHTLQVDFLYHINTICCG